MSKQERAQDKPSNNPSGAEKLNAWECTYIRKQREKGWSLQQLAELFHVSESTISRICTGVKA